MKKHVSKVAVMSPQAASFTADQTVDNRNGGRTFYMRKYDKRIFAVFYVLTGVIVTPALK